MPQADPKILEVAAELADRSADVLMVDGWIRQRLHSEDGHCYYGAQHKARKEISSFQELTDEQKTRVIRLLDRRVARAAGLKGEVHSAMMAARWNDHLAKDGEVEEALRLAGKKIREELGQQ